MKRGCSKLTNLKSKKTKCPVLDKLQKTEDPSFLKEDKQFLNKKQKRQRQENSLDELTRAFIKYVIENKNETININDIVKKLKVKKRRIYDITNVLEGNPFFFYFLGIGYIRKQAKNQVTWLKPEIFQNEKEIEKSKNNPSQSPKKKQLLELKKEEQKLQRMLSYIFDLNQKIQTTNDFRDFCFLTYNDIKELTNKEPDNTLVAITTPEDVRVDILDDERRRKMLNNTKTKITENTMDAFQNLFDCLENKQQVYFSTEKGQLGVYLIMNNNFDKNKDCEFDSEDKLNVGFDPLCSGSQEMASIGPIRRSSLSSESKRIIRDSYYFEMPQSFINN